MGRNHTFKDLMKIQLIELCKILHLLKPLWRMLSRLRQGQFKGHAGQLQSWTVRISLGRSRRAELMRNNILLGCQSSFTDLWLLAVLTWTLLSDLSVTTSAFGPRSYHEAIKNTSDCSLSREPLDPCCPHSTHSSLFLTFLEEMVWCHLVILVMLLAWIHLPQAYLPEINPIYGYATK